MKPVVADRAQKIVADFVSWTPETGPCPIGINDRHWFKKVCAMAERQAMLEDELGLLVTPDEQDARRRWIRSEIITFGPTFLLLVFFGTLGMLTVTHHIPWFVKNQDWWLITALFVGPYGWMGPCIVYRAHQSEKERKKSLAAKRITKMDENSI